MFQQNKALKSATRAIISYIALLLIFIFIIFFMFSPKLHAEQKQTVTIGTGTTYPPYYWQDKNGKMTGFDIDIIEAICFETKLDCILKNVPWNQMIPSLLSEQIDVIAASHSITAERLNYIDFSKRYADTPLAVVVRRDALDRAKNPADALKEITIGTQAGTIGDQYMQRYFKEHDTRTFGLKENYQHLLSSKQVDAVIDDVAVLNSWLQTEEGQCCLLYEILPIDRDIQGLGLGFGVRKTDPELKALLNKGLNMIIFNGLYDKIVEKYFNYRIYGK